MASNTFDINLVVFNNYCSLQWSQTASFVSIRAAVSLNIVFLLDRRSPERVLCIAISAACNCASGSRCRPNVKLIQYSIQTGLQMWQFNAHRWATWSANLPTNIQKSCVIGRLALVGHERKLWTIGGAYCGYCEVTVEIDRTFSNLSPNPNSSMLLFSMTLIELQSELAHYKYLWWRRCW